MRPMHPPKPMPPYPTLQMGYAPMPAFTYFMTPWPLFPGQAVRMKGTANSVQQAGQKCNACSAKDLDLRTVFVSSLPMCCDHHELEAFFDGLDIERIEFLKISQEMQTRNGCAYVVFKDVEAARCAVEMNNQIKIRPNSKRNVKMAFKRQHEPNNIDDILTYLPVLFGETQGPSNKVPSWVSRKVEYDEEATKCTIFLKGLPSDCTKKEISDMLHPFQIKRISIFSNRTAYVNMDREYDAHSAAELSGQLSVQPTGRKIEIEMKRPLFPSPSEGLPNDATQYQLEDMYNKRNDDFLCSKSPVFIDAGNICLYRNNQRYAVENLEMALFYYWRRGHKVYAVIPERRLEVAATKQTPPVSNECLLKRMNTAGLLILIPRKKLSDGSFLEPYDDLEIVKYAQRDDGRVVSNDNMQDVLRFHPEFKTIIESRILFNFAGGLFSPMSDTMTRRSRPRQVTS